MSTSNEKLQKIDEKLQKIYDKIKRVFIKYKYASIFMIGITTFIILPILINWSYILGEKVKIFSTLWGANEVLMFYGSALAFIGTVSLGALSLHQNKKANENNEKALQQDLEIRTMEVLKPVYAKIVVRNDAPLNNKNIDIELSFTSIHQIKEIKIWQMHYSTQMKITEPFHPWEQIYQEGKSHPCKIRNQHSDSTYINHLRIGIDVDTYDEINKHIKNLQENSNILTKIQIEYTNVFGISNKVEYICANVVQNVEENNKRNKEEYTKFWISREYLINDDNYDVRVQNDN